MVRFFEQIRFLGVLFLSLPAFLVFFWGIEGDFVERDGKILAGDIGEDHIPHSWIQSPYGGRP